jgi:hypothetical protein
VSESRYRQDSRVEWGNRNVFYIPDKNAEVWNIGERWTIEAYSTWRGAVTWDVYDPDGQYRPEYSGKTDFDDTLEALMGPPLWDIEAEMLLEACDNNGFLDFDAPDRIVTVAAPLAEAAAFDNLTDGGFFTPRHENGEHVGYDLTDRGRWLAEQIPGRTDREAQNLIETNVPHSHTYGITEVEYDDDGEGEPPA